MKHSVWSTRRVAFSFLLSHILTCRLRQASINMEISLMEKRARKWPVIKVASRETIIAAERWFATRISYNEELSQFKRVCLKCTIGSAWRIGTAKRSRISTRDRESIFVKKIELLNDDNVPASTPGGLKSVGGRLQKKKNEKKISASRVNSTSDRCCTRARAFCYISESNFTKKWFKEDFFFINRDTLISPSECVIVLYSDRIYGKNRFRYLSFSLIHFQFQLYFIITILMMQICISCKLFLIQIIRNNVWNNSHIITIMNTFQ